MTMDALFEPARHEALRGEPWNEAAARAAVRELADIAYAAFDPDRGWPAHPLDDPGAPDEHFHMLYCGSGGVVWALEYLARVGATPRQHDFGGFVQGLVERNRKQMGEQPHGLHSFLLGDAGLLLLQWQLNPRDGVADALMSVVRANLHNSTREQLWGSPGTLLAAIFMMEASSRPEWGALLREGVQVLWEQMEPSAALGGAWLWVQDMYGRQEPLLGAGHGFAGNLFPVLRGARWLDPAQVQAFTERALQTLKATALCADGAINWPPDAVLPPGRTLKLLVQDCHGAPGILCRLDAAPRSAAWDELLLGAGELTWRAGPLSKGASICHGTAGSALALLKLWRRSGDTVWLDRARALALHALGQVRQHRQQYGMGRHSLWTGDLGLACVLWGCVAGVDTFPTLDAV